MSVLPALPVQEFPIVNRQEYIPLNATNVTYENGTVTYTATKKDGQIRLSGSTGRYFVTKNHKTIIVATVKADKGVPLWMLGNGGGVTSTFFTGSGEWETIYSKIETTSISSWVATAFAVRDQRDSNWTPISYKNVMRIDLTATYGAGNEPTTVEQFRADYPEEYYPYHPMSALSGYDGMLRRRAMMDEPGSMNTPLYWRGDEYTDLTGGWSEVYPIYTTPYWATSSRKGIAVKNHDNLYLARGDNTYISSIAFETENRINLTDYKRVVFNIVDYKINNFFDFEYGVSIEKQEPADPLSDLPNYKKIRIHNTAMHAGTFTLDISDITGEYYIFFVARQQEGTNIYLAVDKIWME